jgi:phosphate-selective porin OprO/OprP
VNLYRSGCALVALIAATPALAQTPAPADLEALVRAQAAEIATLKARLDRLEANNTALAQTAPVAPSAATPSAATPTPPVQVAQGTVTRGRGNVTSPYAPQLVPPGPAERDVARAREANAAGVTTEWGAGLPVFHSADGVFTYKPRGRHALLLPVRDRFFGERGRHRHRLHRLAQPDRAGARL